MTETETCGEIDLMSGAVCTRDVDHPEISHADKSQIGIHLTWQRTPEEVQALKNRSK